MKEKIIQLLENLKKDKDLNDGEYKELLEDTYNLLSENQSLQEDYSLCLDVICHVSDKGNLNLLNKELLKECIYKSRIFLYEDTLYKKYSENYLDGTSNSLLFNLSKSCYTLNTGTVLTRDQKNLFDQFKKHRKIVVSAPTSFGKSRIIQEIILDENFHNILIVIPTLALSNELYLKLKNLDKLGTYNITKTTKGYREEKANILLFTPEKALMLIDEDKEITIDFFVMDEIYKIAYEDERKKVFCSCLYELAINHKIENFYLIGPYFKKFSEKFLEKTRSKFFEYSSEIVQKNTHQPDLANNNLNKAIKILKKDEEQSLIYCKTKLSINSNIKKIIRQNITEQESYLDKDFISHLKEQINEKWILVKALEKGVAFHHSDMPSYVKNEVISSYNEKKIKVILCTTTIIEGVNTSAKKVILLDNCKGRSKNLLTSFEIKNIKGRAGRFLEHFIGDIYILTDNLPQEKKLDDIDFSYFDKLLEDEELIQIQDEHIKDINGKDENIRNKERIRQKIFDANVRFEFIKQNRYIPYLKQLDLIKELRENINHIKEISFKTEFPTNEKFKLIFHLCEQYLFSDKEKDRNEPFRGGQLPALINFYVSNHYKSPKDLIDHKFIKESSEKIDTIINRAFKFISTYCEFTMPKYLRAFQNIYNYVKDEKEETKDYNCNLELYLLKLEFGTTKSVEIELKELGLPISIIKKLPSNSDIKELKQNIRKNNFMSINLDNFEKRLLKRYL